MLQSAPGNAPPKLTRTLKNAHFHSFDTSVFLLFLALIAAASESPVREAERLCNGSVEKAKVGEAEQAESVNR